jgi:hypothetical protein
VSKLQLRRLRRINAVFIQDLVLQCPKFRKMGLFGGLIPVDGDVDDGSRGNARWKEN